MINVNTYRVSVLLALQQSLLGQITQKMRAVTCAWNDTEINVRVIFEDSITDDDSEIAEEIGSEVASHFEEQLVNVESIAVDKMDSLNNSKLTEWIFLRKD